METNESTNLVTNISLKTSEHLRINGLGEAVKKMANGIARKLDGKKASMETVIMVNGTDLSVKKDIKGITKDQQKQYDKVHDEAVSIAAASKKKSTIRISVEIEK
ncbi:MAG: hypothetical protein JKY42_08000 [Flavobacteriales bacterium]|nr:hypothetical protein [Flavobacteriales bacterium]